MFQAFPGSNLTDAWFLPLAKYFKFLFLFLEYFSYFFRKSNLKWLFDGGQIKFCYNLT